MKYARQRYDNRLQFAADGYAPLEKELNFSCEVSDILWLIAGWYAISLGFEVLKAWIKYS